jgi:hypothetical protein
MSGLTPNNCYNTLLHVLDVLLLLLLQLRLLQLLLY